jgi:hypothetical protein
MNPRKKNISKKKQKKKKLNKLALVVDPNLS